MIGIIVNPRLLQQHRQYAHELLVYFVKEASGQGRRLNATKRVQSTTSTTVVISDTDEEPEHLVGIDDDDDIAQQETSVMKDFFGEKDEKDDDDDDDDDDVEMTEDTSSVREAKESSRDFKRKGSTKSYEKEKGKINCCIGQRACNPTEISKENTCLSFPIKISTELTDSDNSLSLFSKEISKEKTTGITETSLSLTNKDISMEKTIGFTTTSLSLIIKAISKENSDISITSLFLFKISIEIICKYDTSLSFPIW
ncbi:hypothetical protein MAR_032462 [Mya arenaria]|uniref:Uncharacterized protein n=1 Tax=Mya arenaria TaxID=6604 RepID=A0ABY7F6P8_MYAAR|nr:hypothetical protein MAR_032462 [Mya arenaria]